MINTIEAFNLFCEKYAEKNKNQKLEPGDKAVAILKNCVMIVEADEDKKLKITFTGDEPIVIDDDLDMYVEG
ncbi:MAG: hypothetical protein ACLUV3_03545 [Oscillospiraceae bacterium]